MRKTKHLIPVLLLQYLSLFFSLSFIYISISLRLLLHCIPQKINRIILSPPIHVPTSETPISHVVILHHPFPLVSRIPPLQQKVSPRINRSSLTTSVRTQIHRLATIINAAPAPEPLPTPLNSRLMAFALEVPKKEPYQKPRWKIMVEKYNIRHGLGIGFVGFFNPLRFFEYSYFWILECLDFHFFI